MSMNSRVLFLLACMLLPGGIPLIGQSAKTIEEKKISSRTVYEYFIDEGKDEPVIESIERYNEKGDLLEVKEFNNKGIVKKWEKYAYNEEGKVVEEVYLDARGRVERTEKNIYEDGLRVEKQFYNRRNRLYKKKTYTYEYRN